MLVLMHKILSSATVQKSRISRCIIPRVRVLVAAVSAVHCRLYVTTRLCPLPVPLLTTRPSLRGECRIAQCRQVMVTEDAEREERDGKSFHILYI